LNGVHGVFSVNDGPFIFFVFSIAQLLGHLLDELLIHELFGVLSILFRAKTGFYKLFGCLVGQFSEAFSVKRVS